MVLAQGGQHKLFETEINPVSKRFILLAWGEHRSDVTVSRQLLREVVSLNPSDGEGKRRDQPQAQQ